ncbi:MAG TPA: LysR family transcriptional regulator [Candidatus Avacidaminococcus intestinavium]|uniref:LysR family transcriptional regulator n=1 Tax=Candidatus Avacidaminococcus intestinavium TaxID=2840684 RepID=A0A9D1SKL7_9FIRM|nr:LysR family transcriptional regulator [Candidatus Avacidaminococcus intestinavium]
MNFNQITYFLAILRTGNFSNAAEDCFISQSSLSKQIKALEEELNVELFRRSHTKIFLTDAGYDFFVFAEKVIAERHQLQGRLGRFNAKNNYTISIGSIPVVESYGLASIFAKFQVKMLHQGFNVNIDLFSEEQNTVFNALKSNQVSLAFLRPPYLSTDLYETLLIAVDELVFICHLNNPLSSLPEIDLSTLNNERFILLTPRSTLYQTCAAELTRHKLISNVVSTTGRHAVILEMVNDELGVTLLPRKLLNKQMHPNLVAIKLKDKIISKLVLTKAKNQELNSPAMQFWEFIKEHYLIDDFTKI